MKLAVLFFLAASAAWGQTNALLSDLVPEGSNAPVKVIQIKTDQYLSDAQLREQVRDACIRGRRSICGKILAVFPDGLVVESGYTNLLREPLTSSWLVPGIVTASRASNLVEDSEPGSVCLGTVYLTDFPKSRRLIPKRYDYVVIQGYPAGRYTYHSLGTIHKTVRRFSAQLSKAVDLDLKAELDAQPPADRGK
jgi:hypothetical protein